MNQPSSPLLRFVAAYAFALTCPIVADAGEFAAYDANVGVTVNSLNEVTSWDSLFGENPFTEGYDGFGPIYSQDIVTSNGTRALRFESNNDHENNDSYERYLVRSGEPPYLHSAFTVAISFSPLSLNSEEAFLVSMQTIVGWDIKLPSLQRIEFDLDGGSETLDLPSSLQNKWWTLVATWRTRGVGFGYDYGIRLYDSEGGQVAANAGYSGIVDYGEEDRQGSFGLGYSFANSAIASYSGLIGGVRLFDHFSDSEESLLIAQELAYFHTALPNPNAFTVSNLNDDGEGSLREAIKIAGFDRGDNTITFDPALDGSTLTLTSGELTIDKTSGMLDIDASSLPNGFTIDGAQNGRIFNIPNAGSEVIINNIAVRNGLSETSEEGGGIFSSGNLTLLNCQVTGNSAGNGGAGEETDSYGGRGGGIYNSSGSVTIRNSVVSENSSGDGWGSIGTGGTGGGIYNYKGSLSIYDSTVSRNRTGSGGPGKQGGAGGGIASYDGNLVIFATTISGNFTGNGGGASSGNGGKGGVGAGIYTQLSSAEIDSSSIFENTTGTGGASPDADDGTAGDGGGIYAIECQMSLNRCSIYANRTSDGFVAGSGAGGRFYGGTFSMFNCLVAGNHTGTSQIPAGSANGGGLYISAIEEGTISQSTVANNSSHGYGGGIFYAHDNDAFSIHQSTIVQNEARAPGRGGGLRCGEIKINNSIIAKNTAIEDPDIFGSITESSRQNLLDTPPLLAPLGDYGGITKTMPPLPGSPVIDMADAAKLPSDALDLDSDSDTSESIPFDQRGVGFPRIVGAGPDIGAVEALGAEIFQPDSRIGKRSSITSHRGNNIYNTSGSRQTLSRKLVKKRTLRSYVSFQNDSIIADSLIIGMNRPSRKTKTKVFYLANGRRNVTAALRANNLFISDLPPQETGRAQIRVKAKSTRKKTRATLRFTSRSEIASTQVDTTKLKLKSKKRKRR